MTTRPPNCNACAKQWALWCTHTDASIRRDAHWVTRRQNKDQCGPEGRWFVPKPETKDNE